MQYQITATGETFPANDIRSRFPNVSMPVVIGADTLAMLGRDFTF